MDFISLEKSVMLLDKERGRPKGRTLITIVESTH